MMAQYSTESNVSDNISSDNPSRHNFGDPIKRRPDLRVYSNLDQNALEIVNTFRQIGKQNSLRRLDLLRELKRDLKKCNGNLPDVDKLEFFETFFLLLGDLRWKVVCECTLLIVDIIPQMDDQDLDHCMAVILPRVIPNLGHESTDVRRATLRVLHVYMRCTNNLQNVLRFYIQYGLENNDKNAQKGCILSLPLLFTDDLGNKNLFPLVQSLGNLLVNSDASLFYPIFLAIQRLHYLVGDGNFKSYLQHLNSEAVCLYQKVLSRNGTAASAGRQEEETDKRKEKHEQEEEVDQNDVGNNNVIHISKLIGLEGSPSRAYNHPVPEVELLKPAHELEYDIKEKAKTKPSFQKKLKLNFQDDFILVYGIFPQVIVSRAISSKISEKIDGINQMLVILREASSSHIDLLINSLGDFLDNFLLNLIEDPNFKVTLYGLEMMEVIIERMKMSAFTFVKPIMNLLLKRMGDPRTIVREHDIRVIHRSMLYFPSQTVLNLLLEQKYHRNPKIREEIINRVTVSLLMFQLTEFNLYKLSYDIASMLIDNKRQVRLAALECIAVIATALGPRRLDSLMSTVEAIEQNSEAEGLTSAVKARLSRRDLPRCNPDGTLKYVLNLTTFSGWYSASTEPDIEWVMLASSSNSGTPPKLPSFDQHIMSFNFPSHLDNLQQKAEEAEEAAKGELDMPSSLTVTNKLGQRSDLSPDEESNGDAKSLSEESIKSRDMWRYYLSRFKQHFNLSCSSLDSTLSHRSKHVDWAKENDTSRSMYYSVNYPSDSKLDTKCVDPIDDSNFRHQRASSTPAIPDKLNDTADQTVNQAMSSQTLETEFEPDNLQYCRKNSIQHVPKSVPTSPQRKPSKPRDSSDYEIVYEKPKTDTLAYPLIDQTDSLRLDVPNKEYSTHKRLSLPEQIRKAAITSVGSAPKYFQMDGKEREEAKDRVVETGQSIRLPDKEEDQGVTKKVIEKSEKREERSTLEIENIQNKMEEKDEREYIEMQDIQEKLVCPMKLKSVTPGMRRKQMIPVKPRVSRSISPVPRKSQYHIIRIQPAIPPNANIRNILENIARTEGAFNHPEEAMRAAVDAFAQDAWTTKVEGMLAVIRLATFHPNILQKELHNIVLALVDEVKNLRSSVSRSAIFTLGDLLIKMKKHIEPEMELIGSALVNKCVDSASFIREDCEKALTNMIEEMPQVRSALILIHQGSSHRNMSVRKAAAHFLSILVEKMGPVKALMGPKNIGEHLIQAAAKFLMDGSPHTRYYARKIFSIILNHASFEKLLRKHLSPSTYRNIFSVIESIKRRGIGEKPADLTTPIKL